jgi:hypothetical protein
MHESAFADAARPTRFVILRLPLLEYSLGHELLLIRHGNPLICLNREAFDQLPAWQQILALQQAVIVCHRRWENQNSKSAPMRRWFWRIRKTDYALAIADFRNYLAAGSTMPPREKLPSDDCARPHGAPWLAILYNHVRDWNCPKGLAQWLYLTHLETQGLVKITNETERHLAEEVEKFVAEVKSRNPESVS